MGSLMFTDKHKQSKTELGLHIMFLSSSKELKLFYKPIYQEPLFLQENHLLPIIAGKKYSIKHLTCKNIVLMRNLC